MKPASRSRRLRSASTRRPSDAGARERKVSWGSQNGSPSLRGKKAADAKVVPRRRVSKVSGGHLERRHRKQLLLPPSRPGTRVSATNAMIHLLRPSRRRLNAALGAQHPGTTASLGEPRDPGRTAGANPRPVHDASPHNRGDPSRLCRNSCLLPGIARPCSLRSIDPQHI